jgi:assimilatory nitrate reductase catalytic subunit
VAALYIHKTPVEVSRAWLGERLGEAGASAIELLSGRPASASADQGPIICACMNVGRNRIKQHATLAAVCAETGAGTGCGSCRPEIVRIIRETQIFAEAAE